MKTGDLVKVNKCGLRQLNHLPSHIGIIIETRPAKIGKPEIVYVFWPERTKPTPISVRWLEAVDEKR